MINTPLLRHLVGNLSTKIYVACPMEYVNGFIVFYIVVITPRALIWYNDAILPV